MASQTAPRHSKERVKKSVTTVEIGGRSYEVPDISVCSGIPIKPVYRPEDIADLDYDRDLGEPGSFPFTRGVYPTMYRTHLPTFRNYAGFGCAEDTNALFRKLFESGQMGLSVAFDLPTQLGLDSDDPLASVETGRVGVHVDTLADLEAIFDGIDISRVSTNFTANAVANMIYAMYLVMAEKRGIPWAELRGTVQNDPLKEFLARGNFIFPVRPSVKLTGDTIEFTMKHTPKFNAVSVSSSHIKEAGANNAFAVAMAFANALTYIDELTARGYHVDQFGPNLSFGLCGDMEFFENVCQQRAARRLWARMLKERYAATDPKAMQFRYIAGGGSGSTLTHTYPLLNIARLAFHGLMRILGGTQVMSLQAYDEAYEIPSEESAQMSLLIQAMICYELGVTDVVDPLGGSYFVEKLTSQMEEKIKEYLVQITEWGGPLVAIESGRIQREIAKQGWELQKRIESGEQIVIGVNAFEPEGEEQREEIRTHVHDPGVHERQARRLAEVKAAREPLAVEAGLRRLREDATRGANVMPAMIDAVKAYATVGEMTNVLKEVHGVFKEPSI